MSYMQMLQYQYNINFLRLSSKHSPLPLIFYSRFSTVLYLKNNDSYKRTYEDIMMTDEASFLILYSIITIIIISYLIYYTTIIIDFGNVVFSI